MLGLGSGLELVLGIVIALIDRGISVTASVGESFYDA
jgi:hypothetical protein